MQSILRYLFSGAKTPSAVPDVLVGRPAKGIGLAGRIGYPTVNYNLDKEVPYGVYAVDSNFGKGVLFVSPLSPAYVECHFLNFCDYMDDVVSSCEVRMYNLTRIPHEQSPLLKAFMVGCHVLQTRGGGFTQ